MTKLHDFFGRYHAPLLILAGWLVIGVALIFRIHHPLSALTIGDVDAFYWLVRAQDILQFTSISGENWLLPLNLASINELTGLSLYAISVWFAPLITGISTALAGYFLGRQATNERIGGIVVALIFAGSAAFNYRGSFTVTETLAYTLLPLCFGLAIRAAQSAAVHDLLVFSFVYIGYLITHTSSYMLLPVAGLTLIVWIARLKRGRLLLSGLLGLVVLVTTIKNFELIQSILWYSALRPDPTNTAFGLFAPPHWSNYVTLAGWPVLLLAGVGLVGLIRNWKQRQWWIPAILIIGFGLVLVFYQQVLPRISGAALHPYRLVPYTIFFVGLLAAFAVVWLVSLIRSRPVRLGIIILVIGLLFPQFPGPVWQLYTTSPEEIQSFTRLKSYIVSNPYVITQPGNYSMGLYFLELEPNQFYPDNDGKILRAKSSQTAYEAIEAMDISADKTTYLLISKWKLTPPGGERGEYSVGGKTVKSPQFWEYDFFVLPGTDINQFREDSRFRVVFEDANLILMRVDR